jgi:hypothetical protein
MWLRKYNGLNQYKNKYILEERNTQVKVNCPCASLTITLRHMGGVEVKIHDY